MAKKQPRSKRKASPSSQPPTTKAGQKKKAAATVKAQPAALAPAERPVLPSAWRIAERGLRTLGQHWRLFGLVLLVYLIIDLLLVHGVAQFNVVALKLSLSQVGQHVGGLLGSLSIYSSLFSKAAVGSSTAAGVYQFFEIILISLVAIYALRQLSIADNKRPTLRAVFYQSTYPLVPFLLILLLIGIQLLPLLLGAALYSTVVGSGIVTGALEQLLFLIIFLALAVLSIFWLTRSVIALYIVTLPDMTPLQAFRSAKELVKGRRFSLARKLVFLPVALFIVAAIIVVPCILIWAPLAQWMFYLLSLIGLFVIHAYLYTLYRELLA